jgi:hypothetical protein
MKYSRDSALLLLDLNQAAYDLSFSGKCTLPAGFTEAIPISLSKAVPELLRCDGRTIWGFSTWKNKQQYIAFRGTEDFAEWVADLVMLPLISHAHCGFHAIYSAIKGQVNVSVDAIITGHSLGGAIASLLFAEGGGQLMTFGAPRVGDSGFARTLEGTVRVVNRYDVVPDVPLPPLFQHGGSEVVVKGTGSIFAPIIAHQVKSYRAGVLAA